MAVVLATERSRHATKRWQTIFMDREDILNLYVITNLRAPSRR